MIVRYVWHRCRLGADGTETAEPRRCFFVGATSEEARPLLKLCPPQSREFFLELNTERRDVRDSCFYVGQDVRRWWFLAADDLSRALLCHCDFLPGFLRDHPHIEALNAEVWHPEQLRGLATYRPRNVVFCDEPGCKSQDQDPVEDFYGGPGGPRTARCAAHRRTTE